MVASDLPRDGSVELALTNGHRYEFRLQPVKGDDDPTVRTFSTTVTVIPSVTPSLGAPAAVRARAGRRCARLAWARVPHAWSYEVHRWTGSRWVRIARPASPAVTLRNLPTQRAWRLRVRAMAGAQTGPARTVRVVRRPGRC